MFRLCQNNVRELLNCSNLSGCEIFSNILAHRDYSSGYIAKFIIDKDRMFTENANRSQRAGILDLKTFVPFAKNPPVSRV